MDGITQRGNVLYLPVTRSRRRPRRAGWLVALAATLVVALLSELAAGVEPQPLALDDDGRPAMLIE